LLELGITKMAAAAVKESSSKGSDVQVEPGKVVEGL
jgi:hypothetical protein